MASSFKKSTSKATYPRGTKPSFHNSSLLVSTGVPSLDSLLGGGVAVGTVLLIEEDYYNSYATFLLKYFLSEGVLNGHSLFVSSAQTDPKKIVNDLPSPVDQVGMVQRETPSSETSMKIAWRYQNLPEVESSFSNRFGHFYDLTQTMDKTRLAGAKIHYFPCQWKGYSLSYEQLLEEMRTAVTAGQFGVSQQVKTRERNVLRIAVQSLGTPLWDNRVDPNSLPVFLHSLRALLRQSYAVALLTAPAHLFDELGSIRNVERLCDCVVRLEAFEGSDKESNPLYKDYHGLFHIPKLPRTNTLLPCQPETLDLAFKLKRKKFSIETLHLPPDLSETVSREPTTSRRKKDHPSTTPNMDF